MTQKEKIIYETIKTATLRLNMARESGDEATINEKHGRIKGLSKNNFSFLV